MNQRKNVSPLSLSLSLFTLLVTACSPASDAAGTQTSSGESEESPPALQGVEVPSMEEAEKKAEEEITPENADAEYQKLLDELKGDG